MIDLITNFEPKRIVRLNKQKHFKTIFKSPSQSSENYPFSYMSHISYTFYTFYKAYTCNTPSDLTHPTYLTHLTLLTHLIHVTYLTHFTPLLHLKCPTHLAHLKSLSTKTKKNLQLSMVTTSRNFLYHCFKTKAR
jgi:hypothetical protein